MVLKHIKEPILFQGRKKNRKYFEGWYFKQVSSDLKNSICIIPGISKDTNDIHSFIQTIIYKNTDSKPKLETHYHKFSIEEFKYSDNPFRLIIGKNIFKADAIELDLSDDEYSLNGKITFSKLTKIKTSPISPNIMGYYAYFPFLECYHGIISMSHMLKGSLILDKEIVDFSLGKGYIEKDWGTSFPKEYVWFQSNNFNGSDASIMCSIAHIPFLGTSFQGFICNLSLNNQEYRFASYNHSKILNLSFIGNTIDVTLTNRNLMLKATAIMHEGAILKAPKNGIMNNTIKEGLSGIVNIELTKKTGEILYKGTGHSCGIDLIN